MRRLVPLLIGLFVAAGALGVALEADAIPCQPICELDDQILGADLIPNDWEIGPDVRDIFIPHGPGETLDQLRPEQAGPVTVIVHEAPERPVENLRTVQVVAEGAQDVVRYGLERDLGVNGTAKKFIPAPGQ